MTKFLLHQTDQNGLSHVIRPQEVCLLVPTLWLNSVKLKGVSSRFYNKTYCFDAATATGAPLVANRRTISYGRPTAVAHGPSVTLF